MFGEHYTYAVARIRALEVSLFSEQASIDQLMACQELISSACRFLQRRAGEMVIQRPDADAILSREREKIWEIMDRW